MVVSLLPVAAAVRGSLDGHDLALMPVLERDTTFLVVRLRVLEAVSWSARAMSDCPRPPTGRWP
jgi:hypothetical protein